MDKANKPRILFTDNATNFVLEAFGKEVGEDGLVVDRESKEPILTNEGVELEASRFGGLKKGSEIFIKDDLNSIMNLVDGNI